MVMISGIDVNFPPKKPPYPQQKSVMDKVIKAVKHGENALIESPTGTGKTLALLCAALSCQQVEKRKIYYVSRTHKQLTQVIRELNKTQFSHVKMTVLGNHWKQFLCVNPLMDKENKNHEVNQETSDIAYDEGRCDLYDCTQKFESRPDDLRSIIKREMMKRNGDDKLAWNIEDLREICKIYKFCPKLVSKFLLNDAEIVFCPYNYLIDPFIPDIMNLDFKNTVIIIDEAHNIEQQCREAATFCIAEDKLHTEQKIFENLKTCKTIGNSCNLFSVLLSHVLSFIKEDEGGRKILRGDEIVDVLRKFNITENNYSDHANQLEELRKFKTNNSSKLHIKKLSFVTVEQILKFSEFVFRENSKYLKDFRIGMTDNTFGSTPQITLNIWCLNSSVAFNRIASEAHSVILASGTLTPLNTFSVELDAPFPHRLEKLKLFSKERILVRSVGRIGETNLLFKYSNRENNNAMFDAFGKLLLDVCAVTPGGVLCFLPSYKCLRDLRERWEKISLYQELCRIKQIYFENPAYNHEDIDYLIDEYKKSVNRGGGLMMAVYRGKFAEGIDFEDDYARLVICVGVPFPNLTDPMVRLKMEFNKKHCDWYIVQAFRAVNQAVGRCVRHENDWASIVLVDARYKEQESVKHLSEWAKSEIRHVDDCQKLSEEIKEFARKFSQESVEEKNFVDDVNPISTSTRNSNYYDDELISDDENRNNDDLGVRFSLNLSLDCKKSSKRYWQNNSFVKDQNRRRSYYLSGKYAIFFTPEKSCSDND